MILANARHTMTRDDAQLAARLLARATGEDLATLEQRLADEGIDPLLDDPRLPAIFARTPEASHASLRLFGYVMIRHALRNVGEDDRGIADYVASIFIHFALAGESERISAADDEVYTALADLWRDVNDPDTRRAFLVRAHLGNYALWMSGLFPDRIEHRRWRRGGPDLEYYEELGRNGFQLAAEHHLASELGLVPLYVAAAERFAKLRMALNDVSDRLLFPTVQTPERLMRQVRDAFINSGGAGS